MKYITDRKELSYYLDLRYPVTVHEDPDGGFVAEIQELPGCITQAETIGEVYKAIEDARKAWIEVAYNEEKDIPLPRDMEKYSGRLLVRIPRTLHRDLARTAKREGVSLNQYVTSLLAARVSRYIVGPQAGDIAFATELTPGQLTLKHFGTDDRAIDYDRLVSIPQIVVEESK